LLSNSFNILNKMILESNVPITIISHVSPDGDTIGSAIALKRLSNKLGKEAFLLCEDKPPKLFSFLSDADSFVQEIKYKPETTIAVDCSDIERMGALSKFFLESKNRICIDHHVSNTYFADINIVTPDAAATGEIVFNFIHSVNQLLLDHEIAVALYTAIVMDTGNFSFSNTTDKTHSIVSHLMKWDIDVYTLSNILFRTHSLARTILLGSVLSNLEMKYNNAVCILQVSQAMLNNAGATMEDTEGIIDFGREITGVEIAMLIKEITLDQVKVSLRSKSLIDVRKIAEVFGGGGHQRAAGCNIGFPINTAKDLILNEIQKSLDEIAQEK